MPKFYSQKIVLSFDKDRRVPSSFVWKNKEYRIAEVIASWQDWGFPKGSPRTKTWRLRHHRNYYRVQTEEDEIFEIYLDRKSKKEKGEWYLYQKTS